MMRFNTIKDANAANRLIAREIRRLGRLGNANYNASIFAEIQEIVDGFVLPYTPIADALSIVYDEPSEESLNWYMFFKKERDALASSAINGLPVLETKNNKYVIHVQSFDDIVGEDTFSIERFDPKWEI